mmetsp:Transcript_31556/g.90511  ORF Transcript_31556/g.90511 Transcript_31556/m.90511 type:complete len:216 (+) Transcript_31556:468-1115(+)
MPRGPCHLREKAPLSLSARREPAKAKISLEAQTLNPRMSQQRPWQCHSPAHRPCWHQPQASGHAPHRRRRAAQQLRILLGLPKGRVPHYTPHGLGPHVQQCSRSCPAMPRRLQQLAGTGPCRPCSPPAASGQLSNQRPGHQGYAHHPLRARVWHPHGCCPQRPARRPRPRPWRGRSWKPRNPRASPRHGPCGGTHLPRHGCTPLVRHHLWAPSAR